MFHKIIIGFLAITVIGAAGVGLLDAARPVDSTLNLAPTAAAVEDGSAVEAAALPAQEATSVPASDVQAANGAAGGSGPVLQQQSVDMVGEAWHGAGEVVGVDDTGFDLAMGDVGSVYVELGQPSFWQAQGVTLAVGDFVTVDGFNNGDQIHAATVTTGSGALLVVRTANGQLLWSGGASGQGQNGNGVADGSATGEAQVAAEDWVTLEGTLTALDASNASLLTRAGGIVTFQLGQPAFLASQGVTLNVWETVRVLGFWQDGQFQAGEVEKLDTGERIMLRDPNGRPLWGGPGRAGSGGSGAGNAANGAGGASAGSTGNGTGAQGSGASGGQGNTGQGGRQYRGGRA